MRFIFASFFIVMGCSPGWSIAGLDVPIDESTYIEIYDTDSVIHYYRDVLYETNNWCYIHQRFEDVNTN